MQQRVKRIQCPLLKKEIDDAVCYDIHMNVEGLAPNWTIPKEVLDTADYKDICMRCKNHKE